MAINFPNTPSNGQVFFDTTTGYRYMYDAATSRWKRAANNNPYLDTTDTQVLFNSNGSIDGVPGLTFNSSANTLTANTINAYSMRVTGNLYIGSNTVVISNNSISAEMINVTTVMVAGSAIPTGDQSNAMYSVANAAFGHTNSTLTHSQAVYGAVNSVFGVANAAFGVTNAAFGHSNTTYAAVNSAFDLANTKVSKSGDTITGTLSIVGDLIVSGNTRQINANTLSISDPLIYLAANNYASDSVDIGFVANYVNTGGANVHTGLYRSYGSKEYYLFQGYDKEPINNYIDPTGNNITKAVLNADIRTSNLNLGSANAITWISSGYGVANAAFGKANTALQNTTGVLNGSLTVIGSIGATSAIYSSTGSGEAQLHVQTSTSDVYLFNSNVGNSFGFYDGTAAQHRMYYDRAGNYWNFYTGASARMQIDSSGNLFNYTSVRSPVFYDYDDTAYYVDPASSSYVSNLRVLNYLRTGNNDNYININYDQIWRPDNGQLHIQYSGSGNLNLCNGGGYAYVPNTSLRAPIFYDQNDTGYYCDPNNSSRFSKIVADAGLGTSGGFSTIGGNIGTAIPVWNNCQLEIRNGDAGKVGISFHRAGYTQVSLYHDGNTDLKVDGSFYATTLYANGGLIGFPNYNTGTNTARSYGTWYQAAENLFVAVVVGGPYMNDFYAYCGPSTSTYYTIGRWGDDINGNTKWSTFTFFVKKGFYFWVNTENSYTYNTWSLN